LNISTPNTSGSPGVGPISGDREPIVPAGRWLPFILVTALFFLWGVPNNLNDILIRQLGYFLLAIPAGQLMRRAGYKAGILTGLCLYGCGCFLFWPAAIVAQYWFFLMALFVIASGLAFLETAASPFIAQLGPAENSEQRLNLAQAFNPLGSISAVLIGSRFIFSGIELKPTEIAALQAQHRYQDYLRSETLRVIVPYLVLGAVVLLWAILIARTPFPHTGLDYSRATIERDHSRPVWARRHFVLAVLAQFLYVGAQVGIWSYLITYAQTYTGLPERSAGLWLTAALGALTLGRFISAALLRYVSASRLLGIFAAINAVIVAFTALHPGWLGLASLVVVSFFMSMMFPTIFALGIKGLGTRTKTGGSLLVMSIIGGAALTPVMGKIADLAGVAMAYLVPAVCFICIAIYAWLGAEPRPGDEEFA
jgi:FHS family L-fucose permease-like MFS transporter